MQQKISIPVITQSGQKYTTEQGFVAIKDGIKSTAAACATPSVKKPSWLKVSLASTPRYKKVQQSVHEHKLSTVCEEAKCPNIGECWSHGTATIMLMGAVCTRACRFCSVDTGNPQGWLDPNEIANTAETVAIMDLDYVVLTSVDRDDLLDGGANHYAEAIKAIKQRSPKTKVEALTPDFQGSEAAIDILLASGLDVFAQNVETVERLTHPVRDPRAGYWQTLDVLKYAKQMKPSVLTKTSLMLGLGETEEELKQCMDDCRAANVDILTLGQYLQPTRNHLAVERYIPPEDFAKYREWGLQRGFFEVASGPLVRSSYRADRVFKKNNLDL